MSDELHITAGEMRLLQNPAQYLGGERGSIIKDESEVELHVCLAFPDTYEVGMSHIGFQILYDLINKNSKIWAERAYVPLPDYENLLRQKGARLTSLESKRQIESFDIVGFSLQYELCMNGILNILDLGGTPIFSRDRDETCPLIIGGGPVTYHPEPFADFFDAFLIGDGEELVPEFLEQVLRLKNSHHTRKEILKEVSKIKGVYVPSLYGPIDVNTKNYSGLKPKMPDTPTVITRRMIASLENSPFPTKPIVPNSKAVHNRLSVEVMRGCVRGCRFCQAGYLYRPQRERSPEEIIELVKESIRQTGYEELSLLSLSTADYCSILPLLSSIKDNFAQKNELAVSFPSTRVDALKPELLQEVQSIRRSGFTIAPEAGTQRLRDVINKGVSEQELMETCQNVFTLGWSSVKMYFMIGLPTETMEDIDGIIDLGLKVKKIAGKGKTVTVSVSTHVPKPHTPFQWAQQISIEDTIRIQRYLGDSLKKYGVGFRYHNAFSSFLEGVFARGGRELSEVIYHAYQKGARLDAWGEELNKKIWLETFSDLGVEPETYLRERETDESLPWDHISCDIPKRYFIKEWQRAKSVRTTPDCLTQSCSTCGACDYDTHRNILFSREKSESRLGIVNPQWSPIIKAREAGEKYEFKTARTLGDVNTAQDLVQDIKQHPYSLREYLQTENFAGNSSITLPDPQERLTKYRYRLQYLKTNQAIYYAHLELASMFFRACRRVKIPLCFSQGFNPKPKLSFGPPLQLGVMSQCEYVDLYLYEFIPPDQLLELLLEELPAGLIPVSVKQIEIKNPSIQAEILSQTFSISISEADLILQPNLKDWKSYEYVKARKKKKVTVKLSDVLSFVKLENTNLTFELRYDIKATLKPLEVLEAMSLNETLKSEHLTKIETKFAEA